MVTMGVCCCGEAKVVDREPVTSPPVPAPSPWSDLGSVFGELHGLAQSVGTWSVVSASWV